MLVRLLYASRADDSVNADVYLLTDDKPALLPGEREGLVLTHSDDATELLLNDLRSDDGMDWVPTSAHLTKLEIDSPASGMTYDLAIDASGKGEPSAVDAGLQAADVLPDSDTAWSAIWLAMAAAAGILVICVAAQRRLMGAN